MKRILTTTIGFFFSLLFLAPMSASASEPPLEFSGWIPYWRTATGTADVLPHLSQLTSVMPFGYTMKNDGTLSDTARLTEEPWKSFIAEAKKKKVRVIPSVMWGNGEMIHKILSNTKTRIALEDEIARVVKENNFDGIDIDFEAKKFETVKYFSLFLKGLYQRMGNKWVYCTIEARMPLDHRFSPGAKIPPDAMDYANDYVQMNKYCDRVEIMAYDQGVIDIRLNKARTAPYAPVADPAWVEALVTLASKSIDKKKIIIGVPTYGYEYEVTPLSTGGYKYKVLWPFNYKYATDIATKLGITPLRTSANEIGFSYDPSLLKAIPPTNGESTETQQIVPSSTVVQNRGVAVGTTQPFNFLSWSDAQAVSDKVALAKKLGVRGVAVFKFDGGEDQDIWNVLK
ncbi:MAG: glycosyl hydrolase family 18 protein [Minisyncoccia bacterium]